MQSSLWQRLKQRKMVQWAIGYLAVAYALLEGFDIVGDNFGWPTYVPRVTAVLLGFGFMATLVIAWFHGERGHQRMPFSELVLLAFVAAAGLPTAWWVGRNSPTTSSPAGEPVSRAQFAAFDPASAARSVAVLPFDNLTGDPQNDYLADGITEDIIAALGNNAALRVISRTSVMRYKDSSRTVPEIAAELGVGTVLEGSVRVQGDQVRIVAQLIDAVTDAHLWSETYDGELGEIFALQTRVAQDVAERLNARIPANLADAGDVVPTVDPVAYRYFSRGRELANSNREADRRMARVYFDSAVSLDPEFARAYEAIAELETPEVLDLMPPFAPTPTAEQIGTTIRTEDAGPAVRVSAEFAAEKALSLNPRLVGAQSSLAVQNAIRGRDPGEAVARAKQAVEQHPNDVRARQRYAQILAGAGQIDEAKNQLRAAMANDPMSSSVAAQMGELEFATGNHAAAGRLLERAIRLDSTSVHPRVTLSLMLKERGDTAGALREIEKAAALDPDNTLVIGTHGYLLALNGQRAAAMDVAKQLEERVRAGRLPGTIVAQLYSAAGEVDQAAEWLRRENRVVVRSGADSQHVYMFMPPRMRHAVDELRENPRLRETLDSLGMRFMFVNLDSLPPVRVPGDSSSRRRR